MKESDEGALCDWENNFCNNSNCSILKGLGLDGPDPSLPDAKFPRLSLGFRSAGLPWSFQQVSFVCPSLRQCSHHGLPFLGRPSLVLDGGGPRATRADPSGSELVSILSKDSSITFFLLSLHLTSEKASRILGNGLWRTSYIYRFLLWVLFIFTDFS